jgi:two-component system sensor histidine kinase MtrB
MAGMQLRRTLSLVLGLLLAASLAFALSLIILTGLLKQSTKLLGDARESVRTAAEAELTLLLYSRTRDPLTRSALEDQLSSDLDALKDYINTSAEGDIYAQAQSTVRTYLETSQEELRTGALVLTEPNQALASLKELVAINEDQAKETQRQTNGWDTAGNLLGYTAGAFFLSVLATLYLLLSRGMFRPLLALAHAIERFSQGDRTARAEERGPRELRDMARRFNEMALNLARQREAQLTFLAGVAHDLRNPLSALKVSASIARPDRPLPSEEKIRSVLATVGRLVDRLNRMVGDLLDSTRIEAGQLELHLERYDARSLARDVVELFQGTSAAHTLHLTVPEQPLELECDPLRLEQVLTNLVSNAIKYSPRGGAVHVSVTAEPGQVYFAVRDSGMGISEQERAHLFEPFRRLGASIETIPGVGLGLYVVRRIVDAHGGHIEVQSQPGMGSTFTIHLPVSPAGVAGG